MGNSIASSVLGLGPETPQTTVSTVPCFAAPLPFRWRPSHPRAPPPRKQKADFCLLCQLSTYCSPEQALSLLPPVYLAGLAPPSGEPAGPDPATPALASAL